MMFNHTQIEGICREHLGDEGRLESFHPLSNGAVNRTYKVLWDGHPYILRFIVRDPVLAEVEHYIYQLVRKQIPVPDLLHEGVFEDRYPYAFFSFVDKEHLYEISNDSLADTLSFDLGKVLATLHAFKFPQAGLLGKGGEVVTPFKEGSSPYYEYILDRFSPSTLAWERMGEKRADTLQNFLHRYQQFFPSISKGGVLVHSDFKPVNLLWSREGGLTVLDWEFAHIGHPLLDLGILLRHYKEFPFSINELEKGYLAKGGELPEDWVKRARLTDMVNLVQLLNSPLKRPQLYESLLQSIDFTVSKWSWIDQSIRNDQLESKS